MCMFVHVCSRGTEDLTLTYIHHCGTLPHWSEFISNHLLPPSLCSSYTALQPSLQEGASGPLCVLSLLWNPHPLDIYRAPPYFLSVRPSLAIPYKILPPNSFHPCVFLSYTEYCSAHALEELTDYPGMPTIQSRSRSYYYA